ncbi:uncharacterized protein A4U43_C03F20240 [Asparagus officinalis]|uniref:Uncharacterized protein n=1 Tax=Asparagus officinalis TaxID=4686 RepID=A0A5P1FGR2_ASPOF|nr:uncharacterized protein A4U43_C03F20240 [Asparagus officinalis]
MAPSIIPTTSSQTHTKAASPAPTIMTKTAPVMSKVMASTPAAAQQVFAESVTQVEGVEAQVEEATSSSMAIVIVIALIPTPRTLKPVTETHASFTAGTSMVVAELPISAVSTQTLTVVATGVLPPTLVTALTVEATPISPATCMWKMAINQVIESF